jgi:hypothetical protein
MTLRDQFSRHSLALVSLVVAFSTLGYNTWRNELTEHNRNIREAWFEMLLHVGTLQRITYLAHYDKDEVGGSPRAGWVEVQVLRDLSLLMPEPVPQSADALYTTWGERWDGLGSDAAAVNAIDDAINELRQETVRVLEELD